MSKTKINGYIKDLDVVEYIDYSDISFKKIAIDASNWIFATFVTTWSSSIDSRRLESNVDNLWRIWFSKMFLFINTFLSNHILPIMIFDGVNETPQKALTRLKRKHATEKRNRELEHVKEHGSNSEYLEKLKSTWDKLPTGSYRIIPNFFRAMGVRVIMANNEAELLCSLLQNHGLVDLVWSADADNLTMGCGSLIRGWDKDHKKLKHIRLSDVLKKSGLSFHGWVDFSIIMGCDYNSGGIYGYGGDKCLALIKKYKSYRNIPEDVKHTIFAKAQTSWIKKIQTSISKEEAIYEKAQGFEKETTEIKIEELQNKLELVSSFESLDHMVNYEFCSNQFGLYEITDVTDSSVEDLLYNSQVDPGIQQYVSATSYANLVANIESFKDMVPEWFADNTAYIFDEEIGSQVFEETDIDSLMN